MVDAAMNKWHHDGSPLVTVVTDLLLRRTEVVGHY
jgi:hypothetical protein